MAYCWAFLKGNCDKGAECPFEHLSEEQVRAKAAAKLAEKAALKAAPCIALMAAPCVLLEADAARQRYKVKGARRSLFCWKFVTGECRKGHDCPFEHISKEQLKAREAEKLIVKASRAF